MTLSALIKKGGLSKTATVTPATITTQKTNEAITVAPVATVTVATRPEPSSESSLDETRQSLEETLATACHGLSITPDDVHTALAPEDIKDWHKGNLSIQTLTAFAGSLVQQRGMKKGKIPDSYTKKAMCRHCGPVWLWIEGTVDGCPWCFHRATGTLIPRPLSIDGIACCKQQTAINGNHVAAVDSRQAGKDMGNK